MKSCFDEEAMALVEKGINPLIFPGLKTTITSDESRMINLMISPRLSFLHLECARLAVSAII